MLHKIKDLARNIHGKVLFFPGCHTHFTQPENEEKYKQILRKMGIDFVEMPEFRCCGSPAKNAGYKSDFTELADDNMHNVFRKYGIKKIITNCPSCYEVFRDDYEMNVEHISKTIYKNWEKLGIKKDKGEMGDIAFHDSCHLNKNREDYTLPRKICELMGYNVLEFWENKEDAMCCGAGAGLKMNKPKMANKIARLRLTQTKAKRIVNTCGLCNVHLDENKSEGMQIIELCNLFDFKEDFIDVKKLNENL